MAVIEVERLRKTYGEKVAVADVSFAVGEGEVFGILGPNGAGKTTTVECLTGLRQRDGGDLRVFGLDPRHDHARLTDLVGVSLQTSGLPDKLHVREAVELFASFYPGPADGDELIERLGLAEVRDQRWSTLSGGQQQRLTIALALVGRPRVAVLDELTTGLDPSARHGVWELIKNMRADGVTVVLVTHFMEEAEQLCDRVALIDAGKVVVTGTPAELVEQARGASQHLRVDADPKLDLTLLERLPEVCSVSRRGSTLSIDGSGDVVLAVTRVLYDQDAHPHDLRVEQTRLDEAFLELTGARS